MTILLPYQVEGTILMESFQDRVLLSDAMGIGKTIQVLQRVVTVKPKQTIIVCPASLKIHWQREAKQHFDLDTTIVSGLRSYKVKHPIIIANYEILEGWVDYFHSLHSEMVIGDEIQMIGNWKAKRTKAFRRLCKDVSRVIGMSGTPLTNKPWELWPILNILWPGEFPSAFAFGREYCQAINIFGHWQFNGARHLKQLHARLTELGMIRRTKEQVLPDLPPKRLSVVPLEIERRREYKEAEDDLIRWLAKWSLTRAQNALADRRTRFGYLKRLAAQLKLKAVLEWVDRFLEGSEEKLLLGAIHRTQTPIIPTLFDRYKKVAVQIHGGMSQKERQSSVDRFKGEKKCRLLIAQEQAAGTGYNFPECHNVDLAELPWTPGAVQQFIDRCHRLSSKYPVDVHFLIARDTIEEKLCQILDKKSRILDQVLDGVDEQESTLTVFDLLQESLNKKVK